MHDNLQKATYPYRSHPEAQRLVYRVTVTAASWSGVEKTFTQHRVNLNNASICNL